MNPCSNGDDLTLNLLHFYAMGPGAPSQNAQTPFENLTEQTFKHLQKQLDPDGPKDWHRSVLKDCVSLSQSHRWKYYKDYPFNAISKKFTLYGLLQVFKHYLPKRKTQTLLPLFKTFIDREQLDSLDYFLQKYNPFREYDPTMFVEQMHDMLSKILQDKNIRDEILINSNNPELVCILISLLQSLCYNLCTEISLEEYFDRNAHQKESLRATQIRIIFLESLVFLKEIEHHLPQSDPSFPEHNEFLFHTGVCANLLEYPGDIERAIQNHYISISSQSNHLLFEALCHVYYVKIWKVYLRMLSENKEITTPKTTLDTIKKTIDDGIANYLKKQEYISPLPFCFEKASYFAHGASLVYLKAQSENSLPFLEIANTMMEITMNYFHHEWWNGWFIAYDSWLVLEFLIKQSRGCHHVDSSQISFLQQYAPKSPEISQLIEIMKNQKSPQ